jgi:hypothetical protein
MEISMAAVQLRVTDGTERRVSLRRAVDQASTVRADEARPIDVTVMDVSRDGCRFGCDADLPLGTAVTVGLAGSGMAHGHVVRRDGQAYGCAFDTVLTPEQLVEAFGATDVVPLRASAPWAVPLPAPEIERWSRRRRAGVLIGLALATWAGVVGVALAATA